MLVLAHVFREQALRDAFLRALPSAGVDGTLAERMKGTAAAGNARAKTGSLSNARAVAGYIRTSDDEPLAFAVIVNNYGGAPDVVDRAIDGVVVAMAGFSRR